MKEENKTRFIEILKGDNYSHPAYTADSEIELIKKALSEDHYLKVIDIIEESFCIFDKEKVLNIFIKLHRGIK